VVGPGSSPTAIADRLLRAPWFALLAALGFAAIVLSPMLSSGLLGDDIVNSATTAPGTLRATGAGLLDVIVSGTMPWIQAGRFFPGTAYGGVLFYLVDGNALTLKLFVFAVILIDLALLGVLIVLLTRSSATAALSIAVVPLALQIRAAVYHDPVVAFAGLLPVVTGYLLASLCLFVVSLRSRRRRYLLPSIGLYGLALITYEVTIALVIVYPALAWFFPTRRSVRRAIAVSSPFAALALAAVVTAVALRLANPGGFALSSSASDYARSLSAGADPAQGAYAPNFDPIAIARTLVLQCIGAIPFSFALLAAPMASAHVPTGLEALTSRPLATIALAGAAAVLVAAVVRRIRCESKTPPRPEHVLLLLGLGVFLLVLPNVLIALSPRYQREVHRGIAYLPVFISCLGVGVLGGTLVHWILSALSRRPRGRHAVAVGAAAIVITLTCLGAVNAEINRRSIETANEAVWYPREIAASAMRNGLMDQVPSGATVVTPDRADFIAENTGTAVRTTWSSDPMTWLPPGTSSVTGTDGSVTYMPSETSPVYYLSSTGAWQGNGAAIVGRIRSLAVGRDGTRTLDLGGVRMYLADSPLPSDAALPLFGQRSAGLTGLDPRVIGLQPSDVDVVRSGPGWGLFKTRPGVDLKLGV
jgi:hypothetical protein